MNGTTGALAITSSTSTGSLALTTRGTFTANGSTAVVVNTSAINGTSVVLITYNGSTTSTYPVPYVSQRAVGTSFTIVSNAGDSGTYNWTIIN
jgi:hypothetical protein